MGIDMGKEASVWRGLMKRIFCRAITDGKLGHLEFQDSRCSVRGQVSAASALEAACFDERGMGVLPGS